jgi:hypothetical protein
MLGKFILEFDGLITESQTLHRTFGARIREKKPPTTPTATQRNKLLQK